MFSGTVHKLVSCALALLATSAFAAIPSAERDALIALHNATGGSAWRDRAGWLGAAGTECSWAGVQCDANQTTVVELTLHENNLVGSLPASIGELRGLRTLLLYDNVITGPLPDSVGQLTNLETLILDRNEFSGPIPPSIGNLTKLRLFHIDGNGFTSIPREVGNLTAVEDIDFSYNEITGPLPAELGQLSNLTDLQIVVNHLSGPIPRTFGNLLKLERLGLVANELDGPIPAELGNLSSLISLRLSYNSLDGPVPPELGSLRNLEELDLGANRLTGRIPSSIGNLTRLKDLGLYDNALDGELPPELFRLTALERLNLYRNGFSGPIPPAIGDLTELQVLSLSLNAFTGTIPREIGRLTKLTSLELMSNGLTGTIPAEFASLRALRWFELGDNDLTGTIPAFIGTFSNLEYLSLYDNAFEGPIPPELGNLSELDTLYLTSNRLTGTIPESMRNLRKLTSFWLGYNRLHGEIPSWISELTNLNTIYFPGNEFTGSIPTSIGQLARLSNLYLGDNRLTGSIPRELGNLSELAYLSLEYNEIGGPIPLEFFNLRELVEIRLNDMALSGPLPAAVGNLTKAQVFLMGRNNLEGPIPREIGNLTDVLYLSLGANGFTGTIPPEIGNLRNLVALGLYANALRGPIPPEIARLTSLEDRGSDFHFNLLTAADAATRDFVNRKQYDNDFEVTQTVPPANVRVTAMTDRSVTIEWDPIRYTYDGGGYQVTATTTAGAPVSVTTTRGKDATSIVIRGLQASTAYNFAVATVTHPHDHQRNILVSDSTAPLAATTTARVISPPDVVVTEATTGLVQIGGTPMNEDGFTLTNFGDTTTALTLVKEGAFFTMEPQSFSLAGGASQRVVLRSVSQPPGSYYGYVAAQGDGAGGDAIVGAYLLSAARPAGTVIAEALATRVEVAGAPGSDSVGQARFRNRGTAPLSGIVVSDQPWVVPSPDPITIYPNEIGTVNFTVMRSRRPPEAVGALSANLRLIYVDGTGGGAGALAGVPTPGALGTTSPGVSVTLVTVVDVPRPPVAPSSVPGIAGGEVVWFAPGLASLAQTYGRVVSDISLMNTAASRSIDDLRLFFTPSSGSSSVATMSAITPSQAVSLANVVTSVYGLESAVGSLQMRSLSSQNLAPAARLIVSSDAGSRTGEVPLFRSDRAAAPGQETYLTGLRKSSSMRTDLFVQETSGANAAVTVTMLDANAAVVATREIALTPFGMAELTDVAPASASTAVVSNANSSSGRIVAYARVVDTASGDNWSLVDWPRASRFSAAEPVRIAYVDAAPATGGGRRRAVAHGASARSRTEITIFNPSASESRVRLTVTEAGGRPFAREFTVPSRGTVVVGDAGAGANSAMATAVLTPLGGSGQMIVSARSHRVTSGSDGTAIPVMPATAGLRIGQSQRFPALPDSTLATVEASRPGTFRSTLGLVETSGNTAVVRARLYLDAGRDLAAAAIYRDFTLGAGQSMLMENLVRSIVGASRETAIGELSGIQLQIEVVSGRGSVVPFVIVTENATGDTTLRLE